MNVLITGGTGFVGFHVCRQLMQAGHSVRLIARNLNKAENIYQNRGGEFLEIVQGDITNLDSIQRAVAGCDALVHAAAGTPMQMESVEHLFAVNVDGVKNVVGAALAAGIERIICLSSVTAIFNEDGAKVTADAPPTPSKMPYGQSKVAAEQFLRGQQQQGAPIAILYPGGILGPDDPGFSDSCKAIKHRIEHGFRIFGDGGMQYVDVRDLAAMIRSLVEQGGSGRFLVPGVFCQWTQQADIIEAVSGCVLKRIPAQGWKLRLVGRLIDMQRLIKRNDSPISAETMRYATLWPRISNTEALAERGLSLRPIRETFEDTLRWMVTTGHLDSSLCPKLA
ncbi:MAG: SDR family NAD(P)-dependent oxidoreductase [Pseudomonadota bacterium]